MWYLVLLTVMNAALDNKGVVLVHRISVAGLPINMMDGVLALGVLGAGIGFFLRPASRFQADRVHPALVASMVLFTLMTIVGLLGAALVQSPLYAWANELRSVTAVPLAMLAGYYFLKTPRSSVRFAYLHVLSGVLSAGLILLFFLGKSAEAGASTQVDAIRAIQYVSAYGGLAAALLLFTVLDPRSRMMPVPLALGIMGFCFVGQFATLSRSDWIAATGALLALPAVLPRQGRFGKIVAFALAIPVLLAFLWAGVYVASGVMGRDLSTRMTKRVMTALPFARGDDSYTRSKAWDTRLPGIIRELELFSESPVIGNGFGYTASGRVVQDGTAYYHNVWSSSLAQTGPAGFAAYLVPLVAVIVIGRRMVLQQVDKGSVLIGVIGFTTGVFLIIHGAATMSFNAQRGALLMGLLCGVVLRARAMQLTVLREYAGYLDFDAAAGEGRQVPAMDEDGAVLQADPLSYRFG